MDLADALRDVPPSEVLTCLATVVAPVAAMVGALYGWLAELEGVRSTANLSVRLGDEQMTALTLDPERCGACRPEVAGDFKRFGWLSATGLVPGTEAATALRGWLRRMWSKVCGDHVTVIAVDVSASMARKAAVAKLDAMATTADVVDRFADDIAVIHELDAAGHVVHIHLVGARAVTRRELVRYVVWSTAAQGPVPGVCPDAVGMTRLRDRAVLGLAGAVLLSGCAAPTPREALTDSANEKCREITGRFTGDLAFSGEGIGMADMEALRDRSSLISDLGEHVRGLEKPESGQAELDAWLSKLDEFATDMAELYDMYQNATPGSDMVLAMQTGIVDDAAVAASEAAKKFGVGDCAHPAVESWTIFPSSWES